MKLAYGDQISMGTHIDLIDPVTNRLAFDEKKTGGLPPEDRPT
jgi:hypothetical protein